MNIAVPAVVASSSSTPPTDIAATSQRCTHNSSHVRRHEHTPLGADNVIAECPTCGYVFWVVRRDLVDE